MSRFKVKVCVSLAIFCVYAASVFGQGTDLGTVRGLVTDASGGTVPNARLEVAHTGESVVVQSEAPLTEMELPTISSTLNAQASFSLTRAEVSQYTVGGLGAQFIKIPSRLLNR